ncbi:topoisomerase DNA-binding C4 zinc finger domain-containing protein [Roseovarius dicentrarchi]|uniref:topoisomerase DNA-binding C4 zinc finger domain-containing protein n=1 Tax=Roseovarius dicentrarchi TaxID=2250573 RepID=UPI001EF0DB6E|nr:topoisomerase DNA-binding C4 zinc finger domain-containing protein [Roseovarius dicentrarchi]
MPACPACGVGLPVRSRVSGDRVCGDCGETQPTCPSCDAGWLVERRGRYGAFLSCVRFPGCDGKAKLQKSA